MGENRFKAAMDMSAKAVDQDKLARFVAGADNEPHSGSAELRVIAAPKFKVDGNRGKKVTIRISENLFDEIEFVLENCTAGSQQELLEAIVGVTITDMAKQIRGN